MRMTEHSKVVMRDPMVASAALTTDAKSVNMSKFNRCRIMLFITTNGASGDGTVTLKQGTSTTANTALAYSEYWKCITITGDTVDNDALTRVEASTLTTAGPDTATALYIWEVKADMFDTDTYGSENRYLRLDLAGAITDATHVALVYELYEPRYALGAEDMPSVNT